MRCHQPELACRSRKASVEIDAEVSNCGVHLKQSDRALRHKVFQG